MSDEPTVIGARVKDLPHSYVRGSQVVPCSRCGEPTWLCPASAPLLEQGGRMLCKPCFWETYQEGAICASEGTRREIEGVLGRPVSPLEIVAMVALNMQEEARRRQGEKGR